ncbi:TPA: winged helix-turn-helix transcriptional regulator [Bacillus cereus]|nr:winged helix-turn-helix transcriptional regulator [Bacillus thuringiensis]MED2489960.1 winged helix-turn-helix transcriptional regulator [Bacillus thuringiensis]PRT25356.1 hypothetical protein C6351_27955 [Bacillus thuringiensis]HDR8475904.1 winged helix-turn-helix transcriptional regulator [Bacillus cereus]
MVHKEVYELVPPKVGYSLTIKGESFRPLLDIMREWSEKYMGTTLGE